MSDGEQGQPSQTLDLSSRGFAGNMGAIRKQPFPNPGSSRVGFGGNPRLIQNRPFPSPALGSAGRGGNPLRPTPAKRTALSGGLLPLPAGKRHQVTRQHTQHGIASVAQLRSQWNTAVKHAEAAPDAGSHSLVEGIPSGVSSAEGKGIPSGISSEAVGHVQSVSSGKGKGIPSGNSAGAAGHVQGVSPGEGKGNPSGVSSGALGHVPSAASLGAGEGRPLRRSLARSGAAGHAQWVSAGEGKGIPSGIPSGAVGEHGSSAASLGAGEGSPLRRSPAGSGAGSAAAFDVGAVPCVTCAAEGPPHMGASPSAVCG
jgi:hypothetical protein